MERSAAASPQPADPRHLHGTGPHDHVHLRRPSSRARRLDANRAAASEPLERRRHRHRALSACRGGVADGTTIVPEVGGGRIRFTGSRWARGSLGDARERPRRRRDGCGRHGPDSSQHRNLRDDDPADRPSAGEPARPDREQQAHAQEKTQVAVVIIGMEEDAIPSTETANELCRVHRRTPGGARHARAKRRADREQRELSEPRIGRRGDQGRDSANVWKRWQNPKRSPT